MESEKKKPPCVLSILGNFWQKLWQGILFLYVHVTVGAACRTFHSFRENNSAMEDTTMQKNVEPGVIFVVRLWPIVFLILPLLSSLISGALPSSAVALSSSISLPFLFPFPLLNSKCGQMFLSFHPGMETLPALGQRQVEVYPILVEILLHEQKVTLGSVASGHVK